MKNAEETFDPERYEQKQCLGALVCGIIISAVFLCRAVADLAWCDCRSGSRNKPLSWRCRSAHRRADRGVEANAFGL